MNLTLERIQALRSEFPSTLSEGQNGQLLWKIAQSDWPNIALFQKDSGNSCPLPNGVRVSRDVIIDLQTGLYYDIFQDVESTAVPILGAGEPAGEPEKWIRVPAPTDEPLPDWKALLEGQKKVLEGQKQILEALKGCNCPAFPNYKGSVFGWPVTLKPEQNS